VARVGGFRCPVVVVVGGAARWSVGLGCAFGAESYGGPVAGGCIFGRWRRGLRTAVPYDLRGFGAIFGYGDGDDAGL